MKRQGGRHLVVVRYEPDHDPLDEWVANVAEIDRAPVVWVRETDPTSMRRFLRDLADRRAWLMEPDAHPPRLSSYRVLP